MADFGAPVAQNVDVSPTKGIQTLSDLIGIKQKQQALDTGAFTQQSAQAEATIKQQSAKETQAGAQLLSDPVGNGLVDSDGNPTKNAQTIIMRSMPTTGSEHYENIVKAAGSKVNFNNSVNNLKASERKEVADTISGAAADPNANPLTIKAHLDGLVESKQGTPVYDDYKRIADISTGIVASAAHAQQQRGQIIPAGQEAFRQAALGLGRTVLGASGVVGAGGVSGPPQATSNAAGQTQNRDPMTGTLSQPALGPGATNPASPQVAGQTTRQVQTAELPFVAPRASAAARAAGTAGSDIDRGNQVSTLIQPSKNGIAITSEIDNLAEQVHSGKFVAAISKAAAAVGMSEATYARQVLEKDLGRLRTVASEGAGSDARASTILSGFPTAESDAQTIHNAMDYARGTFKQNLARGDLLNKVKSKDPSLQGLQHADDTLTSSSDPLMHEFGSLKNPADRIDFYKRHFSSPAEAQDFKNKVAGMGHILGN